MELEFRTSNTIGAYQNYWGAGNDTEAEIEALIFDDTDNASKGAINFNPWLTGDQSLPVSVVSFSAVVQGQSVKLEWITETEQDNLGFILERKKTGGVYEMIASYQTDDALKGQGTCSNRTEYSFTDSDVLPGKTYAYRLSDVDFAGKINVIDALNITVESLIEATVLDKPYPNPFNPQTKITYKLAEDVKVSLTVVDLMGRTVARILDNRFQKGGSYSYFWNGKDDLGRLSPSGVYVLVLNAGMVTKAQKVMLVR